MQARRTNPRPIALTIAGSDSGGGAGIQADLKTFSALKVHGTSVVTCLTAQNPRHVLAIQPVTTRFLRQQLEAVFSELPPAAVKTGMLFSPALLREVIAWRKNHPVQPWVVDPVMMATRGATLLQTSALRLLCDQLLPLATLITPNLDEARILSGKRLRSINDMRQAARELHQRWGCAVLLKGGHLRTGTKAIDVFVDRNHEELLTSVRVLNVSTHGTGCTYSAAIAARLAQGDSLLAATRAAKKFITQAIRHSVHIGKHSSLNWEHLRAKKSRDEGTVQK